MRTLPILLAIVLPALPFPSLAAGLNDTGVTQCYNGSSLVDCDAGNSGDVATYPRQDGRFGRDAAAAASMLPKTGGGAAGFDFTPHDVSGNAIAIVGGVPASPPTCVRDNVTGLIWEVKTDDGGLRDKDWTYTWYNGTAGDVGTDTCGGTLAAYSNQCNSNNYVAAVNATGLCGASGGWRMPTRRELLSIVDYGVVSTAIDLDYFPNTVNWFYVSGDLRLGSVWFVGMDDGFASSAGPQGAYSVRLVRSNQ